MSGVGSTPAASTSRVLDFSCLHTHSRDDAQTTQDVHLVTQGAAMLTVHQVSRGERTILGNATSLEVRCIWPLMPESRWRARGVPGDLAEVAESLFGVTKALRGNCARGRRGNCR